MANPKKKLPIYHGQVLIIRQVVHFGGKPYLLDPAGHFVGLGVEKIEDDATESTKISL